MTENGKFIIKKKKINTNYIYIHLSKIICINIINKHCNVTNIYGLHQRIVPTHFRLNNIIFSYKIEHRKQFERHVKRSI